MKLILSADSIRFPLTGVGRYTLELARELQHATAIEELRYFRGAEVVDALPATEPAAEHANQGDSRLTRVKRWLARSDMLLELHGVLSQARRGRALAPFEDHLYHGTNFYIPPFPGRSVVTIHDLSIFTFPQFHPPSRVRYMSREIERSLARTSRIITDSTYTRNEVATYFGWPLDRVDAVPLACSAAFAPRPETETAAVLESHGLRHGGYTLYAGTIEPRKNLERLLVAFALLPAALRKACPLVLVGFRGWNNEAILDRLRRAETEGWARHLGFVPQADLPILYAGARAFAFPSLYEGFGLPVLEAMASGVPVVTAANSSLREIAADVAELCDAEDVDGLRDALHRALTDEAWRAEAIAKGISRAGSYSWRRCAEETIAVYRDCLRT